MCILDDSIPRFPSIRSVNATSASASQGRKEVVVVCEKEVEEDEEHEIEVRADLAHAVGSSVNDVVVSGLA